MYPVFVFGSNEAAIHGAGAARTARIQHGASPKISYGLSGNSFAIPTKNQQVETLPLGRIEGYVIGFMAFAYGHPEMTFQVTRIGCGLAGYEDKDIASMFSDSPPNCEFDTAWLPFLGNGYKYWGTF